jgi:glycosyltransferase involved in cell wall biosynthesis
MIESNKMSQEWVKAINAIYERVLVPSPQQVQYLVDSGVQIPVHYVSLGCDLFMPHLKQRTANKDSFTFLTYSYGDNRKGSELAVSAFLALYEGDENKRLVIKARDSYHVQWLQTVGKHPQIEIVSGVISNARWMYLLENADCFVFPSRAEGYGLPPREATLSQVPTIATRWLGLWDIDQWGYGIDVECLAPVFFDKQTNNAPDAQWAHPSMDSLSDHMAYVVSNYESALLHAARGREYLLTHHTWVGAAQAIRYLLEQYA